MKDLEYKYIEMQSEIVGTFEEPEDELVVVDTRINEISKIWAEQKVKDLGKENFMIDVDNAKVLIRMIEMSKGYLLKEIVKR